MGSPLRDSSLQPPSPGDCDSCQVLETACQIAEPELDGPHSAPVSDAGHQECGWKPGGTGRIAESGDHKLPPSIGLEPRPQAAWATPMPPGYYHRNQER